MNTSLSKFCKDRRLPKSSVYARCQELNFDVSNGLTPAMVEQLEHEFEVSTPPEPTPPELHQITVETGNHQITLSSPQLPQTFTLEGLRTSEAVSFEDPLAVAQQFLAVADNLTSAMQNDIQQRQQRLTQTRQAKDAIATKKQQLELEARLYRLQTQQLDGALSNETAELQRQLAELQKLGKPQETEAIEQV